MNTVCRHSLSATALLVGLALTGSVQAHQLYVPTPTSAAEVPGPASGNTMTSSYVQSIGRMAYLWGWPLVNMSNRATAFSR